MRNLEASLIALAAISAPAQTPMFTPSSALAQLKNHNVKWDGTYFGLIPSINSEASDFLLKHPNDSRPILIAALHDKDRFVIAHVILTFMENNKFSSSSSTWNGMVVKLQPNGTVVISSKQRYMLHKFWHDKYRGT